MRSLKLLTGILLATSAFTAPRDYLPLQVGNQWILETTDAEVLNIEVERSRTINGQTYYLVTGYAPRDLWLWQTDDGELFARDEVSGTEQKVAHLRLGAPAYSTTLGGCEQRAQPAPAPAAVVDQNTLTLAILYEPGSCRDAGLIRETYTPMVGIARRSITTIRGVRAYELIYARVNGKAITGPQGAVVLHSDFNRGSKGWLAGFSDYGLAMGDLRMLAELRGLPEELSEAREGFYIQGMNRSDDLFMFLKKYVATEDGIEPNRSYRVSFDIRFASNAQSGCVGSGGAPGEGVYLKAGAAADEPVSTLGWNRDLRLNIDKGEQSGGGQNAGVVSNIANGLPCDASNAPYVRLRRTYTHGMDVRADERGSLWLMVGTDSGYEGLTGLYFESITVRLEPVGGAGVAAQSAVPR